MLARATQFAAAIAVALLSLPLGAAEAQNGKTEVAAEQTAEVRTGDTKQPVKESRTTGIADVDSCKQQAQGLEGPGRARFMTECLKRN